MCEIASDQTWRGNVVSEWLRIFFLFYTYSSNCILNQNPFPFDMLERRDWADLEE